MTSIKLLTRYRYTVVLKSSLGILREEISSSSSNSVVVSSQSTSELICESQKSLVSHFQFPESIFLAQVLIVFPLLNLRLYRNLG